MDTTTESSAVDDEPQFEYDVALSFAGERRPYVEQVAEALRGLGVTVFYDDYETVSLWGKDLYQHLDYVYRKAAKYCLMFVSSEYAEKVWTDHERSSAQARAIGEKAEYVLPARFDNTEIPGLRNTVGYIDLAKVTPEKLAAMVLVKIGPKTRQNYLPTHLDGLYEAVEDINETQLSATARSVVSRAARLYLNALLRMTVDERRAIAAVMVEGCHQKLPAEVHLPTELLRRELHKPVSEIMNTLAGVRVFGVRASITDAPDEGHPERELLRFKWKPQLYYEDAGRNQCVKDLGTTVIAAMLGLLQRSHYCILCDPGPLNALDFSCLSRLHDDVTPPPTEMTEVIQDS